MRVRYQSSGRGGGGIRSTLVGDTVLVDHRVDGRQHLGAGALAVRSQRRDRIVEEIRIEVVTRKEMHVRLEGAKVIGDERVDECRNAIARFVPRAAAQGDAPHAASSPSTTTPPDFTIDRQ